MGELRATEPLLVAEDLRVDVDGVPSCDGLALRTKGERVLVLGAPRALFEATTGLLKVARGTLAVRGVSAGAATASGVVAGAAMEPPTPPQWTVEDYVTWSARLAGLPAGTARFTARSAIAKLKLEAMAKTQTSKLVPHARRATLVAAAIATCAEVIALEDPLGGLPDEIAAAYATVLAEALSDRAWLLFAPRLALTSPLALAADEAIVTTSARVEAQGSPASLASAGATRFVGRVVGPVAGIREALRARGGDLEEHGAHVTFDLRSDVTSDLTTSELARICDAGGVAILELRPVLTGPAGGRALSGALL